VTILLVEQDVYTAFQFSDRGYVLENGKIVQTGKSSDLSHDPEIQRAYFGI
jgi:branched-chain amino acid transport system ATP-binding protein